MWKYIDSCHKELERREAFLEQSTAYFEDVAKITVNSTSAIKQENQNGSKEDGQANTYDKNDVNISIKENTSGII